MNWVWTEFSECVCTVHCSACGWPSPVQAVLVIGSSRHLLSLPRSLCGAVLGGLLCAASWLRGGGLGIEFVVVIREAHSVQWWVCGDCRQARH